MLVDFASGSRVLQMVYDWEIPGEYRVRLSTRVALSCAPFSCLVQHLARRLRGNRARVKYCTNRPKGWRHKGRRALTSFVNVDQSVQLEYLLRAYLSAGGSRPFSGGLVPAFRPRRDQLS